ncbi:MAG: glycosylase [Herminiimonas sp.]|nr:glycosylase [Herminiimonas sp.]
MFKWKKLGKVFTPQDVQDRPWLKEFAQAPATLVFDDFVRVYFACRPARDLQGQYVSHTAYVDLNRCDLTEVIRIADQPILGLGKLGMFDEFGIYPTSVIRDGDLVKAYYAGWTRCESVPYNVAIGMALSKDDGVSFERVGPGPILSYSQHEPMTVSGPKIRRFNGLWYLWYVAGTKWKVSEGRPESIFKIRMASSQDGVNWTRHNLDLIESILEEDECQASPDVLFYQNRYHMFFCYKYSSNFRNSDRGYRIGYAWSDDMLQWHRDDAKAGIDIDDGDGWDNQSVAYPHVFELDGKLYMMYLGNEVGRYGFGLAVLDAPLFF